MRKLKYLFCSLSVLVLSGGSLFGSIQEHLKIPSDKSGESQMRGIDFIYMINLDQRPEKYKQSLDALVPFGITPYRFSAVNGWELSLEDINEVGVKYEKGMTKGIWGTSYFPENNGQPHHEVMNVVGRNYFSHCMSRGAVAIALSHLSILQDAYDSGYETIWVMEDDIEVIKNPHILSGLIDKLDRLVGKNGWDFLFTDRDTKGQDGANVICLGAAARPNFQPHPANKFQKRVDISSDFRRVGARYGAYSMIVRRSGMKKMLDFTKNGVFLPYDMEYTLPHGIRLYTVREDVVSTQPNALSDNAGPNYKKALIQD